MNKDDKEQSQVAPETLSGSIGNASNPIPTNDLQEVGGNQLLNEKAEKYIREVASIEDLPDAQDQQDMDDAIEAEKNKK